MLWAGKTKGVVPGEDKCYILTRASFFGPPLLRAWIDGVEEKADVCCTAKEMEGWVRHCRLARGVLRHRNEVGAFILSESGLCLDNGF